MTVDEVKALKAQIENEFRQRIDEFRDLTGTAITGVAVKSTMQVFEDGSERVASNTVSVTVEV